MLIDFYGRECPHCLKMEPLVGRLEKETGLTIEKYEVWHDTANAQKMEGYDNGQCGGVPFFVNTERGTQGVGWSKIKKLFTQQCNPRFQKERSYTVAKNAA